ncbi:MAG: tRNA 4-thiouridine(8) synthase ThiI [Clostridia bacterium]|nr:tRNA 4-thiouridine(8) synthase ThiI [Clostridia bacterium]
MKEVILCKYGEIVLKGNNRNQFEALLLKELKRRAADLGKFDIRYMQSTVYIEPADDEAEMNFDEMYARCGKIFGLVGICRAVACEKTLDAILETAKAYLPEKLEGVKTFRCEAKRSDKRFPLGSPELAAEVGGAILSVMPRLKVDLKNPDVTVRIEVRDQAAYIHAGQDAGAGGMPVGSAGRGLLLLSGGIDSPVAGWMMMKRGMTIDALHFESFPYTSEAARDKVFTLAEEIAEYGGRIRIHVISLTHIQEVLRDTCEEDYFTLLLRRFMMRLACMCAKENHCEVLVTGESLGQVASQTLKAMCVTEAASELPIFRPCIGMDKEEIIKISRKIGTFETSILPYEDCCTVFTPRHPRTQPELEKVEAQEALVDVDALAAEAWETRYRHTVG